jgi:hypothetical protein
MLDRFEADLSKVEFRSLTSDEWEALKIEVRRRALAERRDVMRSLRAGAMRWLKNRLIALHARASRRLSSTAVVAEGRR